MYILIPLLIIAGSIAGITAVIWRKKPYLDKLYTLDTAGSVESAMPPTPSFSWRELAQDLFPEVESFLKKSKFYEYRAASLREVEKILRKTRLISLRMDRISDSLIKRIRRAHVNDQFISQAKSESAVAAEKSKLAAEDKSEEIKSISPAFLKNEEQRLIMEIAKNPKDGDLYRELGDLYLEMESWVDAKESYEAAIELRPFDESLKQKLSMALEKINLADKVS